MQLRASSPDRTCPPRLPNMGTGMKGERAFLARASAALDPGLETRRQRGGGPPPPPPGAGRGAGRQAERVRTGRAPARVVSVTVVVGG